MKKDEFISIQIDDLKLGMHVIIDLAWHEHPFLKNNFLIKTETDIEKIKNLGLKKVRYDPSRSQRVAEHDSTEDSLMHVPEEKQETSEILSDKLIKSIHDENLPPPG